MGHGGGSVVVSVSAMYSEDPNLVGGVLDGRVDEDVQAGGDQDRGCEAEQEHQDEVVHQERLGGYPKIRTSLVDSSKLAHFFSLVELLYLFGT